MLLSQTGPAVGGVALQNFSESIQEYLANLDQAPDPTVRRDTFSHEISSAYEVLFHNWLQSREAKVRTGPGGGASKGLLRGGPGLCRQASGALGASLCPLLGSSFPQAPLLQGPPPPHPRSTFPLPRLCQLRVPGCQGEGCRMGGVPWAG